jgi:hypothetical protein
MKGILYVVIALAVAYLWLHFEAPHYDPFQLNRRSVDCSVALLEALSSHPARTPLRERAAAGRGAYSLELCVACSL